MTEGARPQLYCSWFCPFAQRAWMALLHKGVDFEYIEQDPYNKTPEWLAINPRGLVPTIRHNGCSIYESSVCIEYVDEAWPTEDASKSLLPKDPFGRAYVRMWSDFITKKIVSLYYRLLMSQNPDEQTELKATFQKNMEELQAAMDPEGPFFSGKVFGLADIMLAPFAFRLPNVMKHFRDFCIPENEQFERYHVWWKAVREMQCFKGTVPDVDRLIGSYVRYEKGTAQTEVGEAVRKGLQLP